jgi:hypothetical protein
MIIYLLALLLMYYVWDGLLYSFTDSNRAFKTPIFCLFVLLDYTDTVIPVWRYPLLSFSLFFYPVVCIAVDCSDLLMS